MVFSKTVEISKYSFPHNEKHRNFGRKYVYIYIYISFEISYLNKQPSLFGAVAVSLHFLGINNFSLKKEKCIPFNTTAEREREKDGNSQVFESSM